MDISAGQAYLSWYYNSGVWRRTSFLGVQCLKSVSDMWNYQEILFQLKPSVIIEFGTYFGGSALFFAEMIRGISPRAPVLSIDIDHAKVPERVRSHPNIELLESDSAGESSVRRIEALRAEHPGRAFFIVDSDHRKQHVLAELEALRALTKPGDYVVVEDGIVNGHPVLQGWGEGPFEAIAEYTAKYPGDYISDSERENLFGFTFAPGGFLIRA